MQAVGGRDFSVGSGYLPALDGLRAVSALLILLHHARVPGFSSAFLGVEVFFVLSGYIITRSMIERPATLMDFWSRRIRRLFPALFVMVFAYLALASVLWPQYSNEAHLRDAMFSLGYMADYAQHLGGYLVLLRHTWSLGVEEKFYLAWPFFLYVVMVLGKRWGCAFLLLLFLLATVWRIVSVDVLDDYWVIYTRFDTRCAALFFGGLLGYVNPKLGVRWGWIGLLGTLVVLYLCEHQGFVTAQLGFTFFQLFCGLVVCATPRLLGWSILPWLGRVSYGFYLWHYLFIQIGRAYTQDWRIILLWAGVMGLVMAVFSHYCVERRFYVPRHR